MILRGLEPVVSITQQRGNGVELLATVQYVVRISPHWQLAIVVA